MQEKTLRTLCDIVDRKWEKIRQTRLKFNWTTSLHFRPTLFDTEAGQLGLIPTRPVSQRRIPFRSVGCD